MSNLKSGVKRLMVLLIAVAVMIVSIPQTLLYVNAAEMNENFEPESVDEMKPVPENSETEDENEAELISGNLETEEDETETISENSQTENETETISVAETELESDEQEIGETEDFVIENDEAEEKPEDETEIEASGTGYNNPNVTWTLYKNGVLVVEGTGEMVSGRGVVWGEVYDGVPWLLNQNDEKIESAIIRVKGATKTRSMFENCKNLKTVDLSEFEPADLTNIYGMFEHCSSLEEVDLSNFDTTNVTDMRYIFMGCTSLKKIDLSSFTIKSGQMVDGIFSDCDNLREIVNPAQIEEGISIELPVTDDTCSWRKPDGTKVSALQTGLAEPIILSADRIFGITFEGEHVKVIDDNDIDIRDTEKRFERGATESFTFTVVPEDGYDVIQSVEPKSDATGIIISQGSSPNQYIVTPKDEGQGYIRDEIISIKTVKPETHTLTINIYEEESIKDLVVVNGDSVTGNRPSTAQVSNEYDTTVYVKMAEDNQDEWRIPTMELRWRDEAGEEISKRIRCEKDKDSMTEEEKKYMEEGYYPLRLGRIFENMTADIQQTTAFCMDITVNGVPEGYHIVSYIRVGNGVYQEQECKNKIFVESNEDFFIQIKLDEAQNPYKWYQYQVSEKRDDEWRQIPSVTLDGIDGNVWGIDTWHAYDKELLIELKPYEIEMEYIVGDIADFDTGDGARISDDQKRLEVFDGDSLSVSVTPDEGLTMKGISIGKEGGGILGEEDGVTVKENENGTWSFLISDMSRLYDIKWIHFYIEDSFNRLSLSDPGNNVQAYAYFNKKCIYTGEPVRARKVSLSIEREGRSEYLEWGTDYIISYSDNINAGDKAKITFIAKPESTKCRGKYVYYFTIQKADPFSIPKKRLNIEANLPQTNLSEHLVINATYDKDVKPTGYTVRSCDWGGIFNADPVVNGNILNYSIREDANRDSKPARVTLNASFENYRDSQIVLDIYLVKREALVLGGNLAEDKIYDGRVFLPRVDRLQIVSKEGEKLNEKEAADILENIKATLSYHYNGIDGTVYDSDLPPVDVGTYKFQIKVAEENTYYKSEYVDAGTFKISPREVVLKAEDVILYLEDSIPTQYEYTVEGLVEKDTISVGPLLSCIIKNTENIGEYPIQINVTDVRIAGVDGRDITADYHIIGEVGTLHIEEPKLGSYTVIYNLSGKGTDIRRAGMTAGSLIPKPLDPKADGYIFLGWYLDETFTKMWDFDTDTIQNDITLYAGWSKEIAPDNGMELYVQEILPQTYTGKAIKPVITVYAADGRTLLKKNKDYKIEYKNNIAADTKKFSGKNIPAGGVGASITDTSQGFDSGLAYAVITGKGNYTGTVYVNFHITPVDISKVDNAASGITLKYTEAFEEKSGKNAAIVTQFKTKTAKLKFGTDYTLTVKKTVDGTPVTLNSKGQLPLNSGTYTVTIDGKDNYTGSIERELYVASKTQLIKNAKVKCTGTISDVTKEQLAAGIEPQKLEVSINGSPLTKDKDYTVKCTNNNAIGTATVTVKGIGDYFGSKSITFKIKGIAFKEKEFGTVSVQDMTYTGTALTQNDVLLTKNGTNLIYGEDYSISYKNNIKKGKATMVFTAKPSSGYSGSFKKTFMIKPMSLDSESILLRGAEKEEGSSKWKLTESVRYQKGGVMPSGQLKLQLGTKGVSLMAGKDYTIKYNDNQEVSNGKAYMTLTGKGNFTGSITVYFDIRKASLSELYQKQEMTVTSKAMRVTFSYSRYRESREDDWEYGLKDPDYEFKPAITIKDGKKTLVKDVDYKVTYKNNVREQLEYGGTPQAIITGIGNYSGTIGEEDQSFTIPLSIYQYSLSGSRVYVVYDENTDYTYTGEPIKPKVTVYYGSASDIKKAKANGETDESTLTEEKQESEPGEPPAEYAYGLTKLQEYVEGKGGDYVLSYGANTAKGKNGKVIIRGVYNYSGNVTSKFTINPKEIYSIYEPEE